MPVSIPIVGLNKNEITEKQNRRRACPLNGRINQWPKIELGSTCFNQNSDQKLPNFISGFNLYTTHLNNAFTLLYISWS